MENCKNLVTNLKLSLEDKLDCRRFTSHGLKNKYIFGAAGVSVASTAGSTPDNILQDVIPEPPPLPTEEIIEAVVSNGEPTLASMGLGGWGPVGIVQQCLEFLHIGWDIPWWGAIAIGNFFNVYNSQ